MSLMEAWSSTYLQQAFLLGGGDSRGTEEERFLHVEKGLGQVVLLTAPQ